MEVMSLHKFFDKDVEKVLWGGHENNRKIVFKRDDLNSMLMNKEDVVALAKEFNLDVYENESRL